MNAVDDLPRYSTHLRTRFLCLVGQMVRASLPLLCGGLFLVLAGSASAQNWDRPSEGPNPERVKAIGFSALLPGLSQWNTGHRNRAVGFWIAEAAIWTGFVSFRVQGQVRKDSYLEMATLYAGVQNIDGKDDDYLRQIGSWPSSALYDDLVTRRNARTVAGDDPDARAAYVEANRIADADHWAWDSNAALFRFSEKRSESKRSFKRSRNMAGLAVANRIVAMIDAVLLSRDPDSAYRLHLDPHREGDAVEGRLGLTRHWR